MKWDIPLTREQQELVENNLSLVYWVIMESIHVNETIYGFGYEDLYQEGCIWLCHAAATYDPARSRFPTYAKKVVRNGLLSYCRKMYAGQKHFVRLTEAENGELQNGGPAGYRPDAFTSRADTMETLELLAAASKDFSGVSKLGTEALALKAQGYATSEIAARYHAPPSHVGAWISRAAQKLRDSPSFLSGLLY